MREGRGLDPIAGALAILVGSFAAALLLGPAGFGPGTAIRALFRPGSPEDLVARTVVLDLRLPRAVLGLLVGSGLALSGVCLQAYFQNPMAGPYVVGVSGGAGLAVAILLVAAGAAVPTAGVMVAAALAGGLAIVLVVAALAEGARARRTETLLLLGLAVAAIASAITTVLLLMLPRGPEGVLFWLMGSLAAAGWAGVGLVGSALLIGVAIAFWHAPALDAILWGDDVARSVGVEVGRTRGWILLASTVPVAASVATCGVIGFLGLMVPHIARGWVGPTHSRLLPVAVLLGGAWLVIADLAARMLLAPAELPVGAITSAVGAPFLVWITLRRRAPWDSSGSTRRRSSPRDRTSCVTSTTTKRG